MFITLIVVAFLASSHADVSHLGLSDGYNYERPQFALNVPVHNAEQEYHHAPIEQHFGAPQPAVEQQYSAPVLQQYESPIIEYLQPAAPEHVQIEYQAHAPSAEQYNEPPTHKEQQHTQISVSSDYLPRAHQPFALYLHNEQNSFQPIQHKYPEAEDSIPNGPSYSHVSHEQRVDHPAPAPVYETPNLNTDYHVSGPAREFYSAPARESHAAPVAETGGYHYNIPFRRFRS